MEMKSCVKLATAALVLGCAASCQDYEPFSEYEVKGNLTSRNYSENFESTFGTIAPDQNWGFDLIPFVSAETRASNTNSNEWESIWHYEVPGGVFNGEGGSQPPFGWARGDVSNYERAYVYWWFSTHQWPTTLSVNWDHYFVENVYGQPEHSGVYSNNSQFEGAKFGMEYLKHINKGETPDKSPADYPITNSTSAKTYYVDANIDKYSDINDYNQCGQQKEQVMYEYRTSTEDFCYKTTFSLVGNQDHNNWTIQYINGEYYLGMDYWHDKQNYDNYAKVDADGYYNDWIVKLSSGTHQVNEYTRRIMCEDLGNSFDWDFNDVVFDVTAFENEGKKVMITLQAAGGTLPIYIGDMEHEAHALFGVSTSTPVNVQKGGVKRPAVVFTLAAKSDWIVKDGNGQDMLDPNKVPVYVPVNSDDEAEWGNQANSILLQAEEGKAPQKIACPSDTYWMLELTDIRLANSDNFYKWVRREIADDSWVISASINKDKYNASLHYSDYGTPYSNSYSNTSSSSTQIRPWKDLWNEIANAGSNSGINDPQFTQEREIIESYRTNDGGATYQPENKVYRSFISQAPYIYETVGQDDDPIIFSAMYMNTVTAGGYASYGVPAQEIVWPTSGVHVDTYSVNLYVDYQCQGMGTVSIQGHDGATLSNITSGTKVTIVATPAEGYVFDAWTDNWNQDCTNATREITVTQSIQLGAKFKAAEGQSTTQYFTTTEDNLTKNVNDTFTLESYMTSALTNKGAISVVRSDESVIGYNGYGEFTALKSGSCNITMTYESESIVVHVTVN